MVSRLGLPGSDTPATQGLESRVVQRGAEVQVVVPCFDEASRLDFAAFDRAIEADPRLALLFVDDGSRDETRALLDAFARRRPERVRVLALPSNRGKAAAVRAGVLDAFASSARFVAYWDADLSTPLGELARLVAALEADPQIEIALGSRVRLLGRSIDRLAWRHYLGRVVATVAAWALGVPVYDTQCGAKALRVSGRTRALFDEPFHTGWTFDVELLARWLRDRRAEGDPAPQRGVVEVPLGEWHHVAGSKVRAGDLPRALAELWWIRRHHR
jgi:glycosyltransferase involved in cell wall biosynthesis